MNNQKHFLAAQLGASIYLDDDDLLIETAAQLREQHSELALLDGLRLCHLFCGIPKLIRSLNILAPFKHHAIATQPADGEQQFKRVYGSDSEIVLEHLRNIDPTTHRWVVDHAYGDVFAHSSYTLLERELAGVLLLTLSNCHQQALSHVRACRRHGAEQEVLIDVAKRFSFLSAAQRTCLVDSINSSYSVDE
ncbi:MAG: alkylhydroperoxidase/carboxymuconolactone decarboxylase family protein YurZ [Myxococcota bacterium]|jgi:alkylhydroperoxidase/carboxymuconolactone decarboxylase family protein YurZ